MADAQGRTYGYDQNGHYVGFDKETDSAVVVFVYNPFNNECDDNSTSKEETTMSKWEIMQHVAATRKEIETFAQDWADVPGGTRNPLAVADWERLWRQLDELFAALRGCAVA